VTVTKLPRLSGREVIRSLRRAGWVLDRNEGSHHILIREGQAATLSVPVHGNRPIKPGLLKRLIRDAKITNEQFIDLVRGD
jgi:predicted RNA binding protein YcfA (HicA-like mRNA interferase family)